MSKNLQALLSRVAGPPMTLNRAAAGWARVPTHAYPGCSCVVRYQRVDADGCRQHRGILGQRHARAYGMAV